MYLVKRLLSSPLCQSAAANRVVDLITQHIAQAIVCQNYLEFPLMFPHFQQLSRLLPPKIQVQTGAVMTDIIDRLNLFIQGNYIEDTANNRDIILWQLMKVSCHPNEMMVGLQFLSCDTRPNYFLLSPKAREKRTQVSHLFSEFFAQNIFPNSSISQSGLADLIRQESTPFNVPPSESTDT